MAKINYYISGHGFGHATRAIEVINHLPESVEVEIITQVPEWLFKKSVYRAYRYQELFHDPGIIQKDSLRQDVGRTCQRWTQLLEEYPAMARAEADRILDEKVRLAAGDVSPFTIAAARAAGIPSVITANFTWDWIFTAFSDTQPEFRTIIDAIASYYREARLLLRTPLAGDLSVFPVIRDVPLIVRRSRLSREAARAKFGVPPDARAVLISFGGMGLQGLRAEHPARYGDITFLTFDPQLAGPANVRLLDSQTVYHPDAVRASDLVLAKLGYGIVTECIAHRVPIAHPPRADFLEHEILERETRCYVPLYPISEKDLLSGNWDFLYDLYEDQERKPSPSGVDSVSLDGGRVAADWLMAMMNGA
ncbi:MAG: hypothetical protein ACE15F_19770 [bacterium]